MGKKKLTQITEMLEAMGETDTAIDNMKSSLRDSQMISWKVKAGLKIDSDDTDAYADSIRNYVKSAQDVIDKRGYTVSVATKLLFGNNSQMGKDNDAFYAGLDAELDSLQKKLNKKINKAVEDGISIEKDEAIQKLLKQVSDITSAVTAAEDEAEFDMLTNKYSGLSGADLSPDTMKQLSGDLSKYTKQANEGADEARKSSMININAQRNMGKISESEWQEKRQEIDVAYYETKAKSMKKSSDFLMKTIMDAYPEIKFAKSDLQGNIGNSLQELIDNGTYMDELDMQLKTVPGEAFRNARVSGEIQKVLSEYFKNGLLDIKKDMSQMQKEMDRNNVKQPEGMKQSMNDMTALYALSGNGYAVEDMTTDTILNDERWSAILQTANAKGIEIPEEYAKGIEDGSPKAKLAVQSMVQGIESIPKGEVRLDIVAQLANTALSQTTEGFAPSIESKPGSQSKPAPTKKQSTNGGKKKPKGGGNSKKKLHRNAKGGIYDKPILTTFAESGAEAAIPLDGSSRAKALWQDAGRILGMEPAEDKTMYRMSKGMSSDKEMYHGLKNIAVNRQAVQEGANVQIHYAPVIEVKGNADEQVLTRVMEMSQAKFADLMKKYTHAKGRTAFSSE